MIIKFILINLINFYQRFLSFDRGVLAYLVSGSVCRYEISCSEYTKRAVLSHGVFKGLLLGAQRIWRCR